MGLLDSLKMRSAILKQQKGETEAAEQAYEQFYAQGTVQCAYMLPYAIMLLRKGGEANFLKVKEMMVKAQKAPDINPERRQQLIVNYAIAVWKLGDLSRAIELLESLHKKGPCGTVYGVLGFLYIEAGDSEKALAFNREAYEYDDEDSVTLDNLGQTYYRMLGDKAEAKKYFDMAIKQKPGQIDTLYFLSRYDLEKGDKAAAREKLETALEGRFSPLNFVSKQGIQKELDALGA